MILRGALAFLSSVCLVLGTGACGSSDSNGGKASGGASGSGGSAAHSGSGGKSAGGSGGSGTGATSGSGGSAGTGATGTGGSGGSAGSGTGGAASGAWSMGYWASWQASDYPVSAIEWSGMTHIAISFYEPQSDGSLSLLGGNPDVAKSVVDAAHQNGVKAIASIGGADSGPSFQQATSSGTMSAFITSLVALIDGGYDGIDIDWEPLEVADESAAIAIANQVRAQRPNAIMTMPIGYININQPGDLSGYPAIAAAYDQLNIMSYGMAGAWQGWKSWHSSPIYQQDSATPTSIDSTVTLYAGAGVAKAKLGVGIGFYGLCYTSPVTGPDQALGGSQLAASDGTMSYANIMGSYYSDGAHQWDSFARAAYLSFTSPQGSAGCTYVSYDDSQSIGEKAAYIKAQGLGGVIMWEINEGYMPGASEKNPLLAAIRDQVLH